MLRNMHTLLILLRFLKINFNNNDNIYIYNKLNYCGLDLK